MRGGNSLGRGGNSLDRGIRGLKDFAPSCDIRRAVSVPLGTSARGNKGAWVVDDVRGCVLVLQMCVGHGDLTTGSPAVLSLACTL
jgi:hypothetical protein